MRWSDGVQHLSAVHQRILRLERAGEPVELLEPGIGVMLAVLGLTGNLDGDHVLGDVLTPVGAECGPGRGGPGLARLGRRRRRDRPGPRQRAAKDRVRRARVGGSLAPEPDGLTGAELRRGLHAAENAGLARVDGDSTISQATCRHQADRASSRSAPGSGDRQQGLDHHRCSVETWPATAFCRSWTSVSIQDW